MWESGDRGTENRSKQSFDVVKNQIACEAQVEDMSHSAKQTPNMKQHRMTLMIIFEIIKGKKKAVKGSILGVIYC